MFFLLFLFPYKMQIYQKSYSDKVKISIDNLIFTNESEKLYEYRDNSFELINDGILYRSFNSALKSLLGKFRINTLDNKTLNEKLILNNYKGIQELDLYYLDYYNKKYDLNCKNLFEFSNNILYEIFSGEVTNIIEDNKIIIDISNKYLINSITYQVNNINTNKEMVNAYLKDNLKIIESEKKYPLKDIKIIINDDFVTKAFKYNFYIDLTIDEVNTF